MLNFNPSENALADKTILVTGAGDGIGREAAINFAKYGATVILLGKTTSKLEEVYDEIEALNTAQAAIIPLDLNGASEQNYRDMALTIEQQFGKLDGLLHNAGIIGGCKLTPFEQIKAEIWNEVLQVNLTSNFLMTKALLPIMRKAELASIIFTSSTVGKKGRAFWGAYSVSKFAIEGMMQTLADEMDGSSIRVNAINPGGTATNLRKKIFPHEDQSTIASPADLMPLYLYLMSDESQHENGKSFDAQVKR